jgi:hypothetical protein
MPEDPKHAALQALLQDRKSPTPKGRASRPMALCLDTELSMDLEDAEEELAEAKQAVAEAEAIAEPRAGGKVGIDPALKKRVKDAETAVTEAEAAADAATITITFAALKANDYDALLKEHPPREGNERDSLFDYNEATFPGALMAESASKKIKDADGNLVDMDIADVIATMSDGERKVACAVALNLNQRTSSFSDAKSQSRQRSGSSSKRR